MFLEEWKKARRSFETATQKKKPCEKFFGVFNKSTGIDSALKALDDAAGKSDADKMLKAEEVFSKVIGDYTPILIKAAKEDKGANYTAEVGKLAAALQQIGVDFADLRKQANTAATQEVTDKLLKGFSDFIKSCKPAQAQAAAAKRQAILDHGACSEALAEIALAAGAGDAGAIKTAFGTIAVKAKAIEAAITATTAAYQKLAASRMKIVDEWKACKKDLLDAQNKAVLGASDRSDNLVRQVEHLLGEIKDEFDGAKDVVKDAATAAKDATTATAMLLKTLDQLATRSSKLAGPMQTSAADIDGKLDHNRNRIENERDAETDPARKKAITDNIRDKVKAIQADAAAQAKEATANAREILVAVGRFPSGLLANATAKKSIEFINADIELLEKAAQELQKSVAKGDRILGTL